MGDERGRQTIGGWAGRKFTGKYFGREGENVNRKKKTKKMCKIKYNIKKVNMYIYWKYKNKLKLINNNYLVFIAFV
jgi:hypothetical protein